METLSVHEWDDAYQPPAVAHLAWHQERFTWPSELTADATEYANGARLYLRTGTRTLATAQIHGERRALVDAVETAAVEMTGWVPAVTELASAVETDRVADVLTFNIDQMLYHWQTYKRDQPHITGATMDDITAERDQAYSYEALVREVVPRADQEAMPLPDATGRHVARLRERADEHRATAARVMPDPLTAVWPSDPWIGPYSRQQRERIVSAPSGTSTWEADLPHQILRGWARLNQGQRASRTEAASRDAVLLWALRSGLSKSTAASASGVARTTVDRLLAQSGNR
jgi:hypothetical protein